MSEQLTLVLFGCINSGKSSIANALLCKEVASVSARGGETITAEGYPLEGDYWVTDNALQLHIMDTPGISEVDGFVHSSGAYGAAYAADLILFVVNSDITDVEKKALLCLHEANKPIFLVLNQADRYTALQLEEILASILKNTVGVIEQENLLAISAAPLKKVLLVKDNGEEEIVEREGIPDVEKLKNRIVEIARAEGKSLKMLNDFASQFMGKQKCHEQELECLDKEAEDLISNFAVVTALGVGLNPIPLVDMAGGAVSIVALLHQLAKVYNVAIDEGEVSSLAKQLWVEGKELLAGVIATNVFGSLLKSIPFVGTLVGGVVQGGPAGYFVYILGMTAREYFANGKSWSHKQNMRSAIQDIINNTDKSAITSKITQRMREKVGI